MKPVFTPFHRSLALALNLFGARFPLMLVILISVVIGLLMVVVFRYTSDQKAIHVAKDQLKAHLLAVRLFQDQLPVVLSSYGRILRGTGRYLRLAFMPLLIVIIPLTYFIVQVDRYLGSTPMRPGQEFLVRARAGTTDTLNEASIQLPPEIRATSPPVRVPADNEIIWRVTAQKEGNYDVGIVAAGQTFLKRVVVSSGLARLSPARLRGKFWERIFVSAEPALPENSPIQSIEVQYPARNISFVWTEWNWIWLFFVLSLVAGFAFKSILGIEI
jgi:hypothetical protein